MPSTSPIDRTQARLLILAGLFLALWATALTLSPAARLRSWEVEYRWVHWLPWLLWAGLFWVAHRESSRHLPGRDPFLLPIAALLSGWGLLMIWRLLPDFGLRQSLWLLLAVAGLIYGLRLPSGLDFLRSYKYVWLTGGLALTALTLLFGTHPSGGDSPRLWLGCCGVYFQPSEPLKLLLVVYLAAYLADWRVLPGNAMRLPGRSLPLLPLLAPTLMMAGLALLLLVVQRDLGTASIFLFLYTTILYVVTKRRLILVIGGAAVLAAGVAGYTLFDVVRVRIDAWLNPWLDPSGRSYQIVQSLLAVANGGIIGRGPGMGSPGLVPVPHSDFIFTAIAEESGLLGVVGLLLVIALLAGRGLRTALRAATPYRRYLAAGLTVYLIAQSVLIMGGNLRLLPLTGVTLPFVSYGGSSLLTSFFSLLVLLQISRREEAERHAPLANPRPYLELAVVLFAGLAAVGLAAGWWMVVRSDELLARTDNARRAISDRFVQRGAILDRQDRPISSSAGQPGSYTRLLAYPDLSSVIGYTDLIYGQAGLEAGLDSYLRGLQGTPVQDLWLNHLLYGQSPPGLDVRLSLDLDLQRLVDRELGTHTGAAVLLNARSGEVLAMASRPTFDANRLEEIWDQLVIDPNSPLLNRATLGLYPPGAGLGALIFAAAQEQGGLPDLPPAGLPQEVDLRCARLLEFVDWESGLAESCPGPVAFLGQRLGAERLAVLYETLGLFSAPLLRLPVDSGVQPPGPPEPVDLALGQGLRLSPLQMALAAASLSAGGIRPAPHLAIAAETQQDGWMLLPPLDQPEPVFDPQAVRTVTDLLSRPDPGLWQVLSFAPNGPGNAVTWFVGGTLPGEGETPLALVVLLEEDAASETERIGREILAASARP